MFFAQPSLNLSLGVAYFKNWNGKTVPRRSVCEQYNCKI